MKRFLQPMLLAASLLVPSLAQADANYDLAFAVRNGDLEGIKWALNHGANVNAVVDRGSGATVIFKAGRLDVFDALVKAGANVNARQSYGKNTYGLLEETPNWPALPGYIREYLIAHGAK